VLGAIEPVLRRPGGLLDCPRLTADGAVLRTGSGCRPTASGSTPLTTPGGTSWPWSGTGRDGPGTDVLITTIGTLFRGRSEVAGVPAAPAAIW